MQFKVDLRLGGLIETVQPPTAWFSVQFENFIAKGAGDMAYTLPADKQIEVQVAYKDAGGNPVDLPQGNVKWETSDETILTAKPDASDDQKCTLTPDGPIGAAQVTCTGSNVDGSTVIATLDVTVVAGDAVTGTIQPVGEPTPIP